MELLQVSLLCPLAFKQISYDFSVAPATTTTATAVAPATSLPSNEDAGALPGQHSSGVGALPGPASEAGVAVLPLEKGTALLT